MMRVFRFYFRTLNFAIVRDVANFPIKVKTKRNAKSHTPSIHSKRLISISVAFAHTCVLLKCETSTQSIPSVIISVGFYHQ